MPVDEKLWMPMGSGRMATLPCDRAFDFIEQCKTEKNDITKHWEQLGVKSTTAGDSQALIQLQREYCNKHQCLRCRFGCEFLKK